MSHTTLRLWSIFLASPLILSPDHSAFASFQGSTDAMPAPVLESSSDEEIYPEYESEEDASSEDQTYEEDDYASEEDEYLEDPNQVLFEDPSTTDLPVEYSLREQAPQSPKVTPKAKPARAPVQTRVQSTVVDSASKAPMTLPKTFDEYFGTYQHPKVLSQIKHTLSREKGTVTLDKVSCNDGSVRVVRDSKSYGRDGCPIRGQMLHRDFHTKVLPRVNACTRLIMQKYYRRIVEKDSPIFLYELSIMRDTSDRFKRLANHEAGRAIDLHRIVIPKVKGLAKPQVFDFEKAWDARGKKTPAAQEYDKFWAKFKSCMLGSRPKGGRTSTGIDMVGPWSKDKRTRADHKDHLHLCVPYRDRNAKMFLTC